MTGHPTTMPHKRTVRHASTSDDRSDPPVKEPPDQPKEPPVKEPVRPPKGPFPPQGPPVEEPPDTQRRPPVKEPPPDDPNRKPPQPPERRVIAGEDAHGKRLQRVRRNSTGGALR